MGEGWSASVLAIYSFLLSPRKLKAVISLGGVYSPNLFHHSYSEKD